MQRRSDTPRKAHFRGKNPRNNIFQLPSSFLPSLFLKVPTTVRNMLRGQVRDCSFGGKIDKCTNASNSLFVIM